MTEISHKSGRWDRKSIYYSVLCLLLPLPIPIAHLVFGVSTYSQAAYGELGVSAVLLCGIMASVNSGWGRLLAAQAFVILGFVPRLVLPLFTGMLAMTLPQFLILAATPSVFAAVFLAIHRRLARQESAYTRKFVYTMCLAAFGMHALLLPVLLGEPLRSHIIHVANPGEEIIETNPSGTLFLTHSALTPVQATLYTHASGRVTGLQQESLPGYPLGIRVRDEDALIALRMQSEDNVVERIDFVRFLASGLEPLGSYPCTSEENPSHLINNLSPDGTLLALADGGFVDVATGERREMLPANSNPDGRLIFIQWSEPEGRAVYYHEAERRLMILDTGTGSTGTYTLRRRPESIRALTLLPGAKKVWYEEAPLFIEQNAFLEDLADRKRTRITRKQGKARPGTTLQWTGEQRLTYITALGALDSLDFDFDRKKFRWKRHSQLLDMTAHAALARDANWLFWVTQAPQGKGTAIHGKQLR